MTLKDYFNSARVKTIATVNKSGLANLCPCGTARMHDDGTIIIGCVGIKTSRENILRTKKATFMVQNPTDSEYWKQYQKTGEKPYPAGYRFYCSLVKETKDNAILAPIYETLKNRVGEKLANKITTAMIFSVEEVKEVLF